MSLGKLSPGGEDDPVVVAGHTVDAQVVARVQELAGQTQHGAAHVNRWNRVLVAFGTHDGAGVSGGAMTAAQAQDMADRHSSPVWGQVVAELTALEATPQQTPPPPPPQDEPDDAVLGDCGAGEPTQSISSPEASRSDATYTD